MFRQTDPRLEAGGEAQVVGFDTVTEDDALFGHQRAQAQFPVGFDGAEHQSGLRRDAREGLTHGEEQPVGVPRQRTVLHRGRDIHAEPGSDGARAGDNALHPCGRTEPGRHDKPAGRVRFASLAETDLVTRRGVAARTDEEIVHRPQHLPVRQTRPGHRHRARGAAIGGDLLEHPAEVTGCKRQQESVVAAPRVRQLRSQVLVSAGAHFQKCHYNSASCSGAVGFPIPKA